MRTVNLYYVYDNINEIVITPIIPSPNDLSAALGFKQTYIDDEKMKKKYNYQGLDLVRFAQIDIFEDGDYVMNTNNKHFNEIKRFAGKEIISFIADQYRELGIDDNFIEEKEG